MKKAIIIMLILTLFSCGRWKTTKLKSIELCSLSSGQNPGSIMLEYDQNSILNISFGIKIHQDNIYIADNILKRVQILDKTCTPSLVIGQKEDVQKIAPGVNKTFFNFSIIGSIVSDSDENIYIQNRFASAENSTDPSQSNLIAFSPTYILVFDSKGSLLYTLGRRGTPDIPFNFIDDMMIDSRDRLIVITRSIDTWSVYIFQSKKKLFEQNFEEVYFKDSSEGTGRIENIRSFQNGENLLISVAYYENSNFKYRKILNYSIVKNRIDRTIMTISEPQNELFTIINDKLIYLWDVHDRNVRFIVCDLGGNIINNVLVNFPEKRDSYSDILTDENGDIYSYHVINRHMEILRWR
jgi:hypothetical protein